MSAICMGMAGKAMRRLCGGVAAPMVLCAAALTAAPVEHAAAQQEAKELRIAIQFGIGYLPLLVAEERGLIEQQLAREGIAGTKITISRLSGGPALSDAMLSRSIDLAVYGTGGFLVAWDKTRGNVNIKGLCAIAVMPNILLANRPDIKTVRDLGPQDRISVPATIAPQALMLRLLAEQIFGKGQHGKLDPQMVILPHPEGLNALLSGAVAAQVTSPPYTYFALKDPRIHAILTLDEVFGGPSTFLVLGVADKFASDNPKTLRALLAAIEEANGYIKTNRRGAAAIYLKAEKSSMTVDFVEQMLAELSDGFGTAPLRVMKHAEFMTHVGTLRHMPKDWREMFLPLIAERNGS